MITLLWPRTTFAQPEVEDLSLPVHLERGDRAPFTGQLASVEDSIAVSQKAMWCDRVTKRDVDFANLVADTKLTEAAKLAAIDVAAGLEREDVLKRRVEKAERWWRQPEIVAPATVIVMAGIIWLTKETIIDDRRSP